MQAVRQNGLSRASLPLAPLSAADVLGRLISFDTSNPPGREIEAADYLADALAAFGFTVSRPMIASDRPNVVATLQNGSGPVFALNTHLDVVPAGEGWTRPAFRMTADDGRLYGRGACDAKGSAAALAVAAQALAVRRSEWQGTLQVVFVADEEVGSAGARSFAAGQPRVDYAIIGEPTANGVAIAHKGSYRPLIRVKGKAAHSSRPQDGVNAIFQAVPILRAIEAAAPTIAERRHPLCGSASLTVTRINGGHADNVIPEHCDIMIDRRAVPGESEDDVRRELAAMVAHAATTSGVEAEIFAWQPTTGGATATPEDARLVRIARDVVVRHGGIDRVVGLGGACDLVHFNKIGAEGIVLGPGHMGVAHKPDEYVPEDHLLTAVTLYQEIVLRALSPQ